MLNENFRDFLRLLIENEVKVLVVGGYADEFLGHDTNCRIRYRAPEIPKRYRRSLRDTGRTAIRPAASRPSVAGSGTLPGEVPSTVT